MKNRFLIALPLIATLALSAAAQQGSAAADPQTTAQTQTPTDSDSPRANPDKQLEPLKPGNREGFWGHLNPFARKKYVERQLVPIRDRANELDELTADNSRMLRDVDSRATAGIQRADAHAGLADQHAVDAANRAQTAHETAQQASARLHSVSQTVQNLDQYQREDQLQIRFQPGVATLSKSARANLDQLADAMKDQKGYLVEVQGFTPGRGTTSIQQSQRLADSVVRYLVIHHQIPVYRIYELGLGNAAMQPASGERKAAPGSRVEVTLLRNSVGDLQDSRQTQSMAQPQ
jgi:outer membrane protein OmpA-like peptidoglycan-associated protein